VPFESKDIEARYPGWEFHQVARAGGMTFHHLGQLVIYPLFNLNELKISLPKIMFLLFDAVKDTLLSFAPLLRMEVKKEPLGLWIEGKKVASIGMALDRFVTCHGLALNLEFDSKVKSMLRQEYPCGIPGGQYGACEEWEQLKVLPKEEMAELILLRFLNAIRSQI
jgi:lipoate-protein ligase B